MLIVDKITRWYYKRALTADWIITTTSDPERESAYRSQEWFVELRDEAV